MNNFVKKSFHLSSRKVLFGFVCALLTFSLIAAAFAVHNTQASTSGNPQATEIWAFVPESTIVSRGERQIIPQVYQTVKVNEEALRQLLGKAPLEFTQEAKDKLVEFALPMPDGAFSRFRIEDSPIMEAPLAAQYPEIKTYRGQGIDDPTATVRFDLTPAGFHAMILSERGTVFIDPYAQGDTTNYITYYKADYRNDAKPFQCYFEEDDNAPQDSDPSAVPNVLNGTTLRTYRLALAGSGEYTAFFGGTVAGALAGMTTSMNRINGVYERELSVRMIIIAHNHLIIYTNAATDPYSGSPSTIINQNQTNTDSVIGSANYDIGHVFTTGSGGVAGLNVVCATGNKARGTTGINPPTGDPFDIDFVAHEMGHQFGGRHTFNGSAGSCSGGNRSATAAYEPGSGSTIMAYAGICSSQNLQSNSDDYFHVKSLEEIAATIAADSCDVETPTGNTVPSVTVGSTMTIPKSTPFILTAVGNDANGDAITYCWEEYDLGPVSPPDTDADGMARPIFRSFNPTTNPSRTFPKLSDILGNVSSFGEALPTIDRTMVFQVTVRDNRANGGGINTATQNVVVSAAAGPFLVTQPNTAVSWAGLSTQTVTWNVANTSAAPVSAANVKISLSTDGGNTFPVVLLASTANDGTETVTIPNTATTMARVKVEAVGNIFFDVSNVNFTITGSGATSTLTVASVNPTSGVPITVTPNDNGGTGNGATQFTRTYNTNTVVSLTAPATASGSNFQKWQRDGVDFSVSAAVNVTMDANHTMTAVYLCVTTPSPLTHNFAKPAGNGSVTVTAGGGCNWTAVSNAGWINITAGGSGSGNGTVNFAVLANTTGSTRNGTMTIAGQIVNVIQLGNVTPFSFDGDALSDLSVWRPSTGTWFIRNSSNGSTTAVGWGVAGDKLAPGDYDGDGEADTAVWRPSTGVWFIRNSSNETTTTLGWGVSTDVAVPGDYDGDGETDIAVFRPGVWFIRNSSNNSVTTPGWGTTGDLPVVGDYDGDGKADLAVWRPATGTWFIRNSSDGSTTAVGWGVSGDKLAPGDYDGDGKTDIAVWRPSTGVWFIRNSSNGSTTTLGWGSSTDVAAPGDYDGDDKADIAVWRPSTGIWFIVNSSNGSVTTPAWGTTGDEPVPAALIP